MQSNEEYLDSLLKAAIGDEEQTQQPEEPGTDGQTEEEDFDPNKALSAEELLEEVSPEISAEELLEEVSPEISLEGLPAELGIGAEEGVLEETEASLEELLKELEATEELPEELAATEFQETGEAGDELWDGLADEDDEMAEINELLSQSDSENMLDDDMLALLENTTELDGFQQEGNQGVQEADEIDIFALDALQEEEEEEEQKQDLTEKNAEMHQEDKPEPKKEKKGWFGKGKKKKEQKKEEGIEESKEEELSGLELTEEGLLDITAIKEKGEAEEIEAIREKKQKKPGFFSSLMDFLMEEEEEEEEAPKPEKKKKEKKKGKQVKESASEENEAILEELAEEDKKNKKKKKPKKAKKVPKEKKQEEPSKEEGKKLPKKMVIRIFVMCFSFMILLIIPALLLPEVFSLRDARKAYYNEDYKVAYENLIGKHLNSSDSLILEKATILMKLQRKYDSFVNYHKMGKETEALNALLEGHGLYIRLQAEAQEWDILAELDEIHQDILNDLEYMYGVTEDQAGVLISMEDDRNYTEEVERIAGSSREITGGSVPAYRSDAEEQPEE